MFYLQLQCQIAYAFDCVIISPICLTAKALRRITMRSFIVCATETNNHTLNMPFFVSGARYKGVQLRLLGL